MAHGFVKLYGSILESTVWLETPEVKVVWITMLAMADADGIVRASIPGLAHRAGVSIEACECALEKFQSPDPYSQTPDYDGHRIRPVDGGWLLLNHQKYRDMQTPKQARDAERQRKHRKKCDMSRMSHDVAPYTDPNKDPYKDRSIDRDLKTIRDSERPKSCEKVEAVIERALSTGEKNRLNALWNRVKRFDPPSHHDWWVEVIRRMNNADEIEILEEAIEDAHQKRNPAAYVASQCAKYINLPAKPSQETSRDGPRQTI